MFTVLLIEFEIYPSQLLLVEFLTSSILILVLVPVVDLVFCFLFDEGNRSVLPYQPSIVSLVKECPALNWKIMELVLLCFNVLM